MVTVETTLESKPDVETFPVAIFISETLTLTEEPVFTIGVTDIILPKSWVTFDIEVTRFFNKNIMVYFLYIYVFLSK